MSELNPIEIVNQQAEDDGLWFKAQTAPEAYLQQELRKLHKAVEEMETRALADGWINAEQFGHQFGWVIPKISELRAKNKTWAEIECEIMRLIEITPQDIAETKPPSPEADG